MCHSLVLSVATTLHNLLLYAASQYCVDAAYCYRRCRVVCLSVDLSQSWALHKRLNRSRCRLGCGFGWAQGRKHVLYGGHQISPCEGAILKGERYLHSKWLAERARSTTLLQRNPSFGETPDQVHFSCRKLCWKVTKYDIHMLWLTVSVCKLYECPSYSHISCNWFRTKKHSFPQRNGCPSPF